VGHETREHRAHSVRVDELLRSRNAVDHLSVRVFGVRHVELRDRRGKLRAARLRHAGSSFAAQCAPATVSPVPYSFTSFQPAAGSKLVITLPTATELLPRSFS